MKHRAMVVTAVLVLDWGLGGCVLPETAQPTPPPTAREALAPLLQPVTLYPERAVIIEQVGKVVALKTDLGVGEEDRAVFVPVTGTGYFILLENALLEDLQKYTRHGEELVKVSGTVTLYQGRNYLLLSRWSRQEY
jgi:hypothetical protein